MDYNKEILEDYIKLIKKGYCKDCNELCNIYGTPTYPSEKISQAIENILKERQQDKELIKDLENKLTFYGKENL